MVFKLLLTLFITAGLFIIFGINPFAPLLKLRKWRPKIPKKKESAAEFVQRLEGKKRENLIQKSLNETKNSLSIIGQSQRYKRTVRLSVLTGAVGAACALFMFTSPLLMVVLGLGCGLIPLWLTNLSVYSFTKVVNDELETALSMITTSYSRHSDILLAVKETLPHTNEPIKAVLTRFVNAVTLIDSNVESAILRMKADLDNTLFHQWCDVLILCQSDHTLKAGLQPIVNKLSKLKTQQNKNETKMMLPLQETIVMVCFAVSPVPLLLLLNHDWYSMLVHSVAGQVIMSMVAVIVFWSINKAIKLSKPIDYKI